MKFPRRLLVVGLCVACLSVAGTIVAASLDWVTLYLATFDGLADGSKPTSEVGSTYTFTGTGQKWVTVAPNSGVYNDLLVITDRGGRPDVDIGFLCVPARPGWRTTHVAFDLCLVVQDTHFSVEITDVTGVDIAGIKFEDGGFKVGDKKFLGGGGGGEGEPDYHVDMHLIDVVGNMLDLLLVIVTDNHTGNLIASWTGGITGGFRPVGGVVFTKLGTAPGEVQLDNLVVEEYQK